MYCCLTADNDGSRDTLAVIDGKCFFERHFALDGSRDPSMTAVNDGYCVVAFADGRMDIDNSNRRIALLKAMHLCIQDCTIGPTCGEFCIVFHAHQYSFHVVADWL